MVIEQLKRKLYAKIHTEYLSYEKEVCGMAPEEVFERAYEISTIQEIYGNLLEIVPKTDYEQARELLSEKNLLFCFYQEWLKTEDSMREELAVMAEQLLTEWKDAVGKRMAG